MSTFVITEKENQDAQLLASKLEDVRQRKRAYLDFTGAMATADYLTAKNLRVNTQRSIFKSPKLYQDFELVDIYCNSHTLFVITTYGTNLAKIPVIHKQYDILPEAYIVADIKAGMKEGEIKGVIYPEDFFAASNDGRYYTFPFMNLKSIDTLLPRVKKYAGIKSSIGRHLECMNLFIPYIDNKLDEAQKKQLIVHILSCETCKKRLIEAIEFDTKSKGIENYNPVVSRDELRTKETFIRKINAEKHEEQELKGAIDVIYDNTELNELKDKSFIKYRAENLTDAPSSGIKKFIFLMLTVVSVLILIVVFAFNMPISPKSFPAQEKTVEGEAYTDDAYGADEKEETQNEYDVIVPKMGKNKGYTTVSKVSWEVSSKITNDSQKKFLQMAGKSIRLNLQNDLLLSSEIAVNNRVKFDINFMRDGSVESITISESSGTRAVDEVVRQSVENTLQYMHPPKGAFSGRKDPLTLVVNF